MTNPLSWNAYAYVLGNPLNGVDPTGMSLCTPTGESIACVQNDGPGTPEENYQMLGYGQGGPLFYSFGIPTANPSSANVSATNSPSNSTPPNSGALGLTNRQACYADALVNGALGFVPGYNATKTVASLVGFNSGATPFAAGSPTGPQIVAGIASAGAIGADASYAAAGGAAALIRTNDLISRGSVVLQTTSRQGRLLQQAASLERLANVASAAKNLGAAFSLASTAFDLYECSQKP